MKVSASRALRITHVHLENWRNFSVAATELQRRVFLVGPNASGKSNLLDVFRFLHDIVSIGGGFQEAVRKRGGVSRLRCLAARRYSDIVIQLRIGEEGNLSAWQYSLRFRRDGARNEVCSVAAAWRCGVYKIGSGCLDSNQPADLAAELFRRTSQQALSELVDFVISGGIACIRLECRAGRARRAKNDFLWSV